MGSSKLKMQHLSHWALFLGAIVFVAVRGLQLVTPGLPLPAIACTPSQSAISAVYDGGDLAFVFCQNGLITYDLSTHNVVAVSTREVNTTDEAVVRGVDGTIYLIGWVDTVLTEVWTISMDQELPDLAWSWSRVASIPIEFYYGSAAWDGQNHIYIIATSYRSSSGSQIYKFSISNSSVTEAGVLPETRSYAAATWLSYGEYSYVYLFGGAFGASGTISDEVLRYDPSTGNVTTLPIRLPELSYSLSAVWSGLETYLICGGYWYGAYYNFMRYDAVTDEVIVENVEGYNRSCFRPATIYSESRNRIYMFGNRIGQPQLVHYIELVPSSTHPPATTPEPTTTDLEIGSSPRTTSDTTTTDVPDYRFELEMATTRLPAVCNGDNAYKNSAVYDGQDTVYIVCSDIISKYQLSLDQITSYPFIPTSDSHAVSVWVGGETILFFGRNDSPGVTSVWKTMSSDLTSYEVVSSMPNEWFGGAILWNGRDEVFILYGTDPYDILKFNVRDYSWTNLGKLPGTRSWFGAVWADQWGQHFHLPSIFMFGDSNGELSKEILRYDVGEGTTSSFGRLPVGVHFRPGVVWTDKYAYLTCTEHPSGPYNVMRFDPARNETLGVPVRGSVDCMGSSVIYSRAFSRIYMFGNSWSWLEDQPIMYIDISIDDDLTTEPSVTTHPPDCSAVDKYGVLYEAMAGQNATDRCPRTSIGTTTWFCTAGNNFSGRNPNYSGCTSPWLEDIKDIIENGKRLSYVSAHGILRGIHRNLTDASDPDGDLTYFGHEMKFLFWAGQAILELVEDSILVIFMEELTEVAYDIFDHLIMQWSQWEELSQRGRSETGTVFVRASDSAALGLGHRSQVDATSSYRRPFSRFAEFHILAGAEAVSENNEETITFPETFNPKSDSYLEIPGDWAQYFPPELYISFSGLRLNHGNTTAIFPPASWVQVENSGHVNSLEPRKIVNGPLMSFSLEAGRTGNSEVNFTGGGVRITFQHEVPAWEPERTKIHRRLHEGEIPKAVLGSGVCVYWDEFNLIWSSEGCHLISSTPTTTVCECSHLTSFAVIFDLHDYIGKPLALQILTWFLCCLSIFCLIVTLVVFLYSRFKNRLIVKHPRNDLTLNLCIALLVSNILILTTLDKHYLNLSDGGCVASAILLHYVLMCAFAWMALEGGLLAKLVLIDVFASGREHARAWTIGAFVVPAVIVAATCAENFRRGDHAYGNDAFCCLHGSYLRSFITIVAVVLIFNASVLVMAIRKSCLIAANPDRAVAQKGKSAGFWIRGALGLTFIMGLTWISGFLMLIDNETVANVAAYIFTITNASQGIFIFMFHIVPLVPIRQQLKSVIALVPSFAKQDKITEAQTPTLTIAKDE